jgi:hypothetical protein
VERIAVGRQLMSKFAERTGIGSERGSRRYLWTDAFAVCNFFALDRPDLATALIEQVHGTLGRHRDDDGRRGWLSGLGDREGAAHPTRGGLRIGKPLPERRPGEPFDERLEWERDGQYFHYLTRWMHALDVAARITDDLRYHDWSFELAGAAFAGFVRDGRMAWKMSVDLSRPLVSSMGQHDPLDGLITGIQIADTRARLRPGADSLAGIIRSFAEMIDARSLVSADPLGIGGLLVDAYRLAQVERGAALVPALLEAALAGLERFARGPDLGRGATRRLAFRELGLAIGIAAVDRMGAFDAPRSKGSSATCRSARRSPRSGSTSITGPRPVGAITSTSTR